LSRVPSLFCFGYFSDRDSHFSLWASLRV
jgi:hypothetical protein